MSKIRDYLKQSAGAILLILALLVVQAYCDLALPEYTSKIVNVGIQQGGIEHASPEELRGGEMEKILLFAQPEAVRGILSSYIQEEDVYQLRELTVNEREDLDQMMSRPMAAVFAAGSQSEMMDLMLSNLKEQLPEQMGSMSIFEILKSLPEEQSAGIRDQIIEGLSQMPDAMISQSAIAYAKEEYIALNGSIKEKQMNYIISAGIRMLGLAFLAMAATVLVTLLASRVGAAFGKNLRNNVFKKVVGFTNHEFDTFSTASLITRTTNDIQQVQMVLIIFLRMIFYAPIVGFGGFMKVWQTTRSMAWVIGVAVAAVLIVVFTLVSTAMPKFQKVQRLIDKLNLVTREILTGIPVIRAFHTEKHEEKRFHEANENLTKTNLFVNRIMNGMMPSMMLIMNLTTVLIVWVGADRINTGTMQVGNLMAFIQYAMQIVMAFLMLSMISVMLPRAIVSGKRIEEVLGTDSGILDPKTPEQFNISQKGELEFRNVSFRYPDADEYVLKNIDFQVKQGETLAIIGSTGSGKSTLINLIPRFYDVTEGEILIDGLDIRKSTQKDLRNKIGIVPQKGVLFSGTIESNIMFGLTGYEQDRMKHYAKIAQAEEFVEEKPDQYESPIAQGGTNVSGGQKQRLAIARALAIEPEICIFDDSFSALDSRTETAVRRELEGELSNVTKIIIAQKISTVMSADQILVLDEGQIVGKGTHKELIQSCEIYNQIALSQLSKEELANE